MSVFAETTFTPLRSAVPGGIHNVMGQPPSVAIAFNDRQRLWFEDPADLDALIAAAEIQREQLTRMIGGPSMPAPAPVPSGQGPEPVTAPATGAHASPHEQRLDGPDLARTTLAQAMGVRPGQPQVHQPDPPLGRSFVAHGAGFAAVGQAAGPHQPR
ncbi:hypothetical protein [Herbidospora mongoliensis]|uniref:hypothetical protein n=1 Tax=Herbidospora mongoliensis TaxID=688067 RepID=UPI0008363B92|nr:hypothetical protein [Herbidospora mongoliensis]